MAVALEPSIARTVTVKAGTTLFQLASQYLGDAVKWNQISDLNPALGGDPYITAVTTIVLPPNGIASNGGLIAR